MCSKHFNLRFAVHGRFRLKYTYDTTIQFFQIVGYYWKNRLHSLSISAQNTYPILVTILFAMSLSIK